MAEDMEDDQQLLVGIDQDDIKTNIYEGGFKTWECSVDLAKYVAEVGAGRYGARDQRSHYIEVHTAQRQNTLCTAELTSCSSAVAQLYPP